MLDYSLAHLSDSVLLNELAALVVRDRLTTAELLAHIAEVDSRKLYVPAGYPSMHAYCVEEFRLSEDAAFKRIRAARAARRFPALFSALTEGRLHLAAISLIAGHLTQENADDMIAAATHRKKSEMESWLAHRFPTPEPRDIVRAIAVSRSPEPAHAGLGLLEPPVGSTPQPEQLAPGPVESSANEAAATPPERYLVQVTISKTTHAKLRYAQELLSHAVRGGDLGQVLDRALDALIARLERRKIGAARHPQTRPRSSKSAHHVPAHVRRAVWERDRGQCTFSSPSGKRCPAKKLLEFDHVEPVARGGRATVTGMRLRCRAHNQYEAERAFGAGFMSQKREAARARAAEKRMRETEAGARAAARERKGDVIAGLRSLGCRTDEARRAAEFSETAPGAPLEQRMRAALQFLSRRSIQRSQSIAVTETRTQSP
jgi:5-methylcytosine-specific restriction endonuclease McrA